MKIASAGSGYAGFSNAGQSPIVDAGISKCLQRGDLNFRATLD